MKQQLVNEQVLALLGVMPVHLDATDAETDQIRAEAELQTDRLPDDDDAEFGATRRQKLHSPRALVFQVEVYRRYCAGETVRTIASALRRPSSSVQRALEAARALAGDRYKVTVNSKSVVFAEIVNCAECRKSQALWGTYCKAHDQKIAAATDTVAETLMANDDRELYEFNDEIYQYGQQAGTYRSLAHKVTDLDS